MSRRGGLPFRRGATSLRVAIGLVVLGTATAAGAAMESGGTDSMLWVQLLILGAQMSTLTALLVHDRWERKAVASIDTSERVGKARVLREIAHLRKLTEELNTSEERT